MISIFTFPLWNIHMNGQYPNWDSTNVFIRIPFCLKLINLDNLANTASFLPIFLHSEITWSSKLRFFPISIPSNFCFSLPPIFSSPILTQTFYTYAPKLKGDICLCWVSCHWFQIIQLLKKRRALIFWSDCLDRCHKLETNLNRQNKITQLK